MSPDQILSKNTLAIDEILEEEEDSHEQSKASPYESISSYSRNSKTKRGREQNKSMRSYSKKGMKRRGAILRPKEQLKLGLVSRKAVTK